VEVQGASHSTWPHSRTAHHAMSACKGKLCSVWAFYVLLRQGDRLHVNDNIDVAMCIQ
jgi:hypothetical protein